MHNVYISPHQGLTHPSSSLYLCAKEIMSEALPLPSHTTTGTGGSSLRLSRTMEITLGPPSKIRQTRGTPWPKPRHTYTPSIHQQFVKVMGVCGYMWCMIYDMIRCWGFLCNNVWWIQHIQRNTNIFLSLKWSEWQQLSLLPAARCRSTHVTLCETLHPGLQQSQLKRAGSNYFQHQCFFPVIQQRKPFTVTPAKTHPSKCRKNKENPLIVAWSCSLSRQPSSVQLQPTTAFSSPQCSP